MTVLPERPGRHFARVDALRGIAALLVAGMHASQARWGKERYLFQPLLDTSHPTWDSLTRLLRGLLNGHGAVTLFFVLSGFVLSLSLERGPQGFLAGARRFFGARVFRLYPAVVVAIAAFSFVYYATGGAIPGVRSFHYSIPSLFRNALLLETTINGVMWTLQVEVLAAPLVFLAYRLRRHFGDAAVILLGLLFVGLSFTRSWAALINPRVGPLQGMYAFLFGMLVPTVGRAFAMRVSGRVAAGTAATTVLLFFNARRMLGVRGGMLVEAWAGAAFIALLVYGPPLRAYRALDFGIVRFYGKISYSFYLLHPLTFTVIWKMPDVIGAWIAAGIPPAILTLALWMATTAVVTPIAMASYRFVELPAMQLWRRVGWAGAEPTGAAGEPPPGS